MKSDLNKLNAKFGAADRIAFRESPCGLPEAILVNTHGHCEISLYGGQVLNYRPMGHAPTLFNSRASAHERGKRIFGGIPLCWPWFGEAGEPELPRHGFARLSQWEVLSTTYDSSTSEITLGLIYNDQTLTLWPHRFELVQRITLSDNLTITVSSYNRDKHPFRISQSIHPYFKVRDIAGIAIHGLDGHTYTEGADKEDKVLRGNLTIDEFKYALFDAPDHAVAIRDSALRRDILLKYHDMQHLVVWNPGRKQAAAIPDFGNDEYTGMLTVAPVMIPQHAVTVQPGEMITVGASLQAVLT